MTATTMTINLEGFSEALQKAHNLTEPSYKVQVIEGQVGRNTELYGLALTGLNRVIMQTESNDADMKAAIKTGIPTNENQHRRKIVSAPPPIDYGKPNGSNRFN